MRALSRPHLVASVFQALVHAAEACVCGCVWVWKQVRRAPDLSLHLQAGKFDAADRCFTSVANAWRSVLTNVADVKELIPEFFRYSLYLLYYSKVQSLTGKWRLYFRADTSFLENQDGLDLGLKQNGLR